MTNEEIESSLKVIATTHDCNECKIRNCKWGTCNCSQITARAALDLINRQKAEIEKLEKALEGQDQLVHGLNKCYYQAKSKAIKEFGERLKNKIKTECNPYGKPTFDYDTSIAIMRYIDNLVKEMVGEDNA